MKTITINSDIFTNEWATSFLKALMGNKCTSKMVDIDSIFVGFVENYFIIKEKVHNVVPWTFSLTFNLDELSVDWACLHSHSYIYAWSPDRVLKLDYLAKQKGIEIK